MYHETKMALKKAFEISRILFFMGEDNYRILLKAVSFIKPPSKKELDEVINKGKTLEEAMEIVLKEKYTSAATNAGFSKKHGLAVLKYAAILEEINE